MFSTCINFDQTFMIFEKVKLLGGARESEMIAVGIDSYNAGITN